MTGHQRQGFRTSISFVRNKFADSFRVSLFIDLGSPSDLGKRSSCFMIIRWPISWLVYQWRHLHASMRTSNVAMASFFILIILISIVIKNWNCFCNISCTLQDLVFPFLAMSLYCYEGNLNFESMSLCKIGNMKLGNWIVSCCTVTTQPASNHISQVISLSLHNQSPFTTPAWGSVSRRISNVLSQTRDATYHSLQYILIDSNLKNHSSGGSKGDIKLYVDDPPWGSAPPPTWNPGSAPGFILNVFTWK